MFFLSIYLVTACNASKTLQETQRMYKYTLFYILTIRHLREELDVHVSTICKTVDSITLYSRYL